MSNLLLQRDQNSILYRPIVGNATSNEKKRVIVNVSNNFVDTEGCSNDSGCSFDHRSKAMSGENTNQIGKVR